MSVTEPEHVAERKALNAALAKAQAEFPEIPRSKTVKARSYEFSYAPLDKILKAVRPVLAKHGLSISQPLDDGYIRTELRHEAGGVISGRYPLKDNGTAQDLGATITYLRRYSLTAMLGIAADDDTDGPDPSPFSAPKLKTEAEADGPPAVSAKPEAVVDFLTEAQRRMIFRLKGKLEDVDLQAFDEHLADEYESTISGLSKTQASELIEWLKRRTGEA